MSNLIKISVQTLGDICGNISKKLIGTDVIKTSKKAYETIFNMFIIISPQKEFDLFRYLFDLKVPWQNHQDNFRQIQFFLFLN